MEVGPQEFEQALHLRQSEESHLLDSRRSYRIAVVGVVKIVFFFVDFVSSPAGIPGGSGL
jgi:hypothetical protein